MKKHFEKKRFVKCYKYKFNFDTWEDYTETDDPGIYRLTFSHCPASVEGTRSRYRCNGKNDTGSPCVYAPGYAGVLIPESEVPKG